MKKSELLKIARKKIESKEQKFVCIALLRTGLHGRASLVNWIEGVLLGRKFSTYNNWLTVNHPTHEVDPTGYYTEARLAWIDWMIQYWEEQGD